MPPRQSTSFRSSLPTYTLLPTGPTELSAIVRGQCEADDGAGECGMPVAGWAVRVWMESACGWKACADGERVDSVCAG